jgi:hypothetical protein
MGVGAVTNVQDGVQSGMSGEGGIGGGKGYFLFIFWRLFFVCMCFRWGYTHARALEGDWRECGKRCNKELKVWFWEGGCVRAPLGGGSRVQLVYLCIS